VLSIYFVNYSYHKATAGRKPSLSASFREKPRIAVLSADLLKAREEKVTPLSNHP
jgi:hypothetical protein